MSCIWLELEEVPVKYKGKLEYIDVEVEVGFGNISEERDMYGTGDSPTGYSMEIENIGLDAITNYGDLSDHDSKEIDKLVEKIGLENLLAQSHYDYIMKKGYDALL